MLFIAKIILKLAKFLHDQHKNEDVTFRQLIEKIAEYLVSF
jgi:hypothetical protein